MIKEKDLMETVCGLFTMALLKMLQILVLVILDNLIHTIKKIYFSYYVKDQLMVLMIALVQQKKISINFSNAKTRFCLCLHYNDDDNLRCILPFQEEFHKILQKMNRVNFLKMIWYAILQLIMFQLKKKICLIFTDS